MTTEKQIKEYEKMSDYFNRYPHKFIEFIFDKKLSLHKKIYIDVRFKIEIFIVNTCEKILKFMKKV